MPSAGVHSTAHDVLLAGASVDFARACACIGRSTIMKPKRLRFAAILVAALTLALVKSALAQDLARAKTPEEVGLSSERLERLSAAFKAGVDKGEIPGAVVLIARKGKVAYFSAFGFRDREAAAP